MHSMRFFITTILLMFATSVVANPLLEKRCIDHGPCNSAVECCSRYCYNYVSQRAIFQINVRALNNPICFAELRRITSALELKKVGRQERTHGGCCLNFACFFPTFTIPDELLWFYLSAFFRLVHIGKSCSRVDSTPLQHLRAVLISDYELLLMFCQ